MEAFIIISIGGTFAWFVIQAFRLVEASGDDDEEEVWLTALDGDPVLRAAWLEVQAICEEK